MDNHFDLRFCPSCGSSPIIFKKYTPEGAKVYKVACRGQHGHPPCLQTDWHQTKETAVVVWNASAEKTNREISNPLAAMKL